MPTTYRRLLVSIDLHDTENAEKAVAHAEAIARADGGKVRLVHVLGGLPIRYRAYLPQDYEADEFRDAEAELARWAAKIELPDERLSAVIRRGSVSDEILAEAVDCQADLVVIGARMPGVRTKLLGSTASSIVSSAPISVLVVR